MTQGAATSFYWHDYETFGLDWPENRPAQFAGIRTGPDLDGGEEADIWYCRPSDDLLPSPDACMVTGITPADAAGKGICEADFAALIHSAMNEPGTVNIGYNSISFDDEVTRFLFWRSFLDVYGRENRNGCSRWDLFPFVHAVWALRPEGISWPVIREGPRRGRVSFKLEDLSAANGLSGGRKAHDAANDVRATIALARLIREKQPRLWEWAFANRSRQKVKEALGRGICVWVDSSAGQERGYIRCVLPVSSSASIKTETVVWDCREDPSVLVGMPPEEIRRLTFSRSEDLGKGESRLPLKGLRINRSPFVCSDLRILTPAVCARFSIDPGTVRANAEKLVAVSADIQGPVLTAFERKKEEPEDILKKEAERALYGAGFTQVPDEKMMDRLWKAAGPRARFEAVREGRVHFADPRLQAMLPRMLARSWPELLDDGERASWQAYCSGCLKERLEGYFDRVDRLGKECEEAFAAGSMSDADYEERQRILGDLYEWGERAAGIVSP